MCNRFDSRGPRLSSYGGSVGSRGMVIIEGCCLGFRFVIRILISLSFRCFIVGLIVVMLVR